MNISCRSNEDALKVVFVGSCRQTFSHRLGPIQGCLKFGDYFEKSAPPSKTLLDELFQITSPEGFQKQLWALTGNEKQRIELVKALTKDPHQAFLLRDRFIERLGGGDIGKKRFKSWYLDEERGYKAAFKEFLIDLYQRGDLDNFIRFQPNWEPKRLLECAPPEKFRLGKLPAMFGSEKDYQRVISKLKKLILKKERWAKIKGYPERTRSHMNKGDTTPFRLKTPDKTFIIRSLGAGYSSPTKFIFSVCDEETRQTLVIKMDPEFPKNKKPEAVFDGDTVALNALIDFYAQENGSEIPAKLYFYDYQNNAAIYEYVERSLDQKALEQYKTNEDWNHLLLKDLNAIGLYWNNTPLQKDGIHCNVYFDSSEKPRSIDSGHFSFMDIWKPLTVGLTRMLPNHTFWRSYAEEQYLLKHKIS